jgi:7,8-dihydropterin-6-yl-methyl-4-(beta-D-ribofuranosyl)aminobenzene 5'-phosphate synthase
VGGLPDFLSRNADVRLFVPPSFDAPSRAAREIFPVADPMEIDRGIYLTGELAGIEQALLVKTGKGLVTIVGCSHPGIGMILEKAEGFGKTKSLIGGFHGFNQFDLLEDIDLVCPTHCTQYKEEIAVRYPKAFIEGGVSRVIEIS